MNDNLKIFQNISYNAMTRIVTFLFQGISNIILTRILSPDDYGVVGFAGIFINFLTLFNDIGINSAIIQRRDLDEKGLYTAFTMKAVLGLLLFLLIYLLAPFTFYFFDNKAVSSVLRILALNFLLNIFFFIPNSLLSRELDYKKISYANVISAVVSYSTAIILALTGFNYWSIVLSNLVGTLTVIFALNLFKPVSIKVYWDKNIAKEFIRYGWSLFASGIMIFTIFNADNFIVGSVKGSTMLGYYAIAFNWATIICISIHSIVHSVLFPTFSKIQGDREKIKSLYLKVLEYTSFGAILGYLALFIVAKEFLIHVLGHGTEKWLPALVTLKILCFYGILRSICEPVGNVIMAVGKTELIFKANLYTAILELAFLYPALKYFGIEGAAIAVTVAYIVQFLAYIPFLKEELNIHLGQLIKSVLPSVFSLAVILIFYFIFESLHDANTLFVFIQKAVAGILSYLLLYGFLTKWKILKEAKNMLASMNRA